MCPTFHLNKHNPSKQPSPLGSQRWCSSHAGAKLEFVWRVPISSSFGLVELVSLSAPAPGPCCYHKGTLSIRPVLKSDHCNTTMKELLPQPLKLEHPSIHLHAWYKYGRRSSVFAKDLQDFGSKRCCHRSCESSMLPNLSSSSFSSKEL